MAIYEAHLVGTEVSWRVMASSKRSDTDYHHSGLCTGICRPLKLLGHSKISDFYVKSDFSMLAQSFLKTLHRPSKTHP